MFVESHVASVRGRQTGFFPLFKDRPQQHGCRLPDPASSSLSRSGFWGRGAGGTCVRWPIQGVQSRERQHRSGLEGFLEEERDNKLQGWQKQRFFLGPWQGLCWFCCNPGGPGKSLNWEQGWKKGVGLGRQSNQGKDLFCFSSESPIKAERLFCFAFLCFQKFPWASLVLDKT